jgi:hypothetical protein
MSAVDICYLARNWYKRCKGECVGGDDPIEASTELVLTS